MAWTVELSASAERALKKLDRQGSIRIKEFIDTRLEGTDDPRRIGKPLRGTLDRYWSYRVGDHRLLCELHDEVVVVLIATIGHRHDIYR